jgi:hypothetical protein
MEGDMLECDICYKKFSEEDIEGRIHHFMEEHEATVAKILEEELEDYFSFPE